MKYIDYAIELSKKLKIKEKILNNEQISINQVIGCRNRIVLINVNLPEIEHYLPEFQIINLKYGSKLTNEFENELNIFRGYLLARNYLELSNVYEVKPEYIESFLIELPLYRYDYCLDEINYTIDYIKNPECFKIIENYLLTGNVVEVLSWIILDLRLLNMHSFVKEFFLKIRENDYEAVKELLSIHLLYFILPVISCCTYVITNRINFLEIEKYSIEFITYGDKRVVKKQIPIPIEIESQISKLLTLLIQFFESFNILIIPLSKVIASFGKLNLGKIPEYLNLGLKNIMYLYVLVDK